MTSRQKSAFTNVASCMFSSLPSLRPQSLRRTKRMQPRAIRKMQEVTGNRGTDNTLPRERRSLYFRFRYRVSKPQGFPINMLRKKCFGIRETTCRDCYANERELRAFRKLCHKKVIFADNKPQDLRLASRIFVYLRKNQRYVHRHE